MQNKYHFTKFLLLLNFIPLILYSQTQRTLKLTTYPRSQILIFGENNNKIKELRETIPKDLEVAISSISDGKILFLNQLKTFEAIEKKLGDDKFYDKSQGIIEEARKIIFPDGILFVKIEESSTISFTIRAKVVNLNTEILAEKSIEIEEKDELDKLLNSKINELAKSIIKQLGIGHHNFDSNRFVNYSTISSSAILTGSLLWYLLEDSNVDNNYQKYKNSKSIEGVTKFRIETEKSLTRKSLAKTGTIISGTALVFFLIRDGFWHPSIAEKNNKFENIKTLINYSTQQKSFLIKIQIIF